jgi:endoglucanase
MPVPALLDELLRAPGPSGLEDDVSAIVRREAAELGAAVEADVLGSTVARVQGSGAGRVLALVAHVDQVGVAVTHVFEDGLLGVAKLASWEAPDAIGQRFRVLTAAGPIPAVAVRVGEGDPAWGQVRLDVGASGAAAASGLVRVGDPAVLDGPPVELAGGRVVSAALDDRAGVYAALEALRRLAADPPRWDVALVASTQEEGSAAGGIGAAIARLRPAVAIVVEVTFATGSAGLPPEEWGAHDLGDGPAVFRGPIVSPVVAARLLEVASAEGIEHCLEAGGSTWSDADEIMARAGGTATGMVSIPLRSMHTANEVVDLADVDGASRLLEAFARSLGPDDTFVR